MRLEIRFSENVTLAAQVRYQDLLNENGTLIEKADERATAVMDLLDNEIVSTMTALGEGYGAAPVLMKPQGYTSTEVQQAEQSMKEALEGWCGTSDEWAQVAADAVTDALYPCVREAVRQWVVENHEEVVREHHWPGC